MKFFWGYPAQAATTDFAGLRPENVPVGTYVLMNRARANFLNRAYGYVLPEFYAQVPSSWIVKWRGIEAELYQVPPSYSGPQ